MVEKERKSPYAAAAKAVGIGLSFGICLGVEVYFIGIVLGGWLDQKLGTQPWLMVVCVLLAVVAAFRQLFLGLDIWQKRGRGRADKE